MYNIYVEEKKQREEKEKEKKEKMLMRYKKRHKKEMEKMYENYENRVKDFISDMAHPGHEIVVQDITQIQSSRADIMNKCDFKPKPFIFKGYKTEADRIKDTIRNNRYLYNIPDPPQKVKKTPHAKSFQLIPEPAPVMKKSTRDLQERLNALIHSDVIIQPQMRFKARTDLERVFDALTGNYFRNTEREILNRQLRNLNLFESKKPIDILRKSVFGIDDEEEEKNQNNKKRERFGSIGQKQEAEKTKSQKQKIIIFTKPKKPWIKRQDLNIEAQGLLSDYHYKTHFKAAEEIAENKIDWKPKDKKNLPKNGYCNTSATSPNSGSAKKKKKREIDFQQTISEEDGLNNSYIKYDKNFNPIIKKNIVEATPESMKMLTKLAFTKNDDKKDLVEDPLAKHETKLTSTGGLDLEGQSLTKKMNLVDDNSVLIGNQLYHKGTQFDIIANKVLNICNVYHKKSRHNNTTVKKREGKLMVTRGLTVSQFEKKYGLKD